MSPVGKPLRGLRVLVVDDDEDTREVFALVLEDAGAEVRTVGCAKEALRAVLEWRPSLVTCDVAMPTTDGFAFLRALRSTHQCQEIPAIAVTGMASPAHREAAFAAGFQEQLTKPIEPTDLIARVKHWATARPIEP
jgi:CheY-like chemotaxis protein